jgi:hypothetical protein
MNNLQRILLFFVLPAISPLLLAPPLRLLPDGYGSLLQSSALLILVVIGLEIILFIALGFALLRGRLTALTLSIFLQGLNVVVRLMMFFPNAMTLMNTPDILFILTSIVSMCLSMYILLRLDRIDIRSGMA